MMTSDAAPRVNAPAQSGDMVAPSGGGGGDTGAAPAAAAVNDDGAPHAADAIVLYPPGAMVSCSVCGRDVPPNGGPITGQVVAFDQSTLLLTLRTTEAGSSRQGLTFVNTALASDITVLNEAPDNYKLELPPINMKKAQSRLEESMHKKRAMVAPSSVPPAALRLFLALRKTLDDTRWEGESIVVVGRCVVRPPYDSAHVAATRQPNGEKDKHNIDQTIAYVLNIIEKHERDELRRSSGQAAGSGAAATNASNDATPW